VKLSSAKIKKHLKGKTTANTPGALHVGIRGTSMNYPNLSRLGITIHATPAGLLYVLDWDIRAALGDEKFKQFKKRFGDGHTCPCIEVDGVHAPAVFPWDAEFTLS
jgi:hypothetical protein